MPIITFLWPYWCVRFFGLLLLCFSSVNLANEWATDSKNQVTCLNSLIGIRIHMKCRDYYRRLWSLVMSQFQSEYLGISRVPVVHLERLSTWNLINSSQLFILNDYLRYFRSLMLDFLDLWCFDALDTKNVSKMTVLNSFIHLISNISLKDNCVLQLFGQIICLFNSVKIVQTSINTNSGSLFKIQCLNLNSSSNDFSSLAKHAWLCESQFYYHKIYF